MQEPAQWGADRNARSAVERRLHRRTRRANDDRIIHDVRGTVVHVAMVEAGSCIGVLEPEALRAWHRDHREEQRLETQEAEHDRLLGRRQATAYMVTRPRWEPVTHPPDQS